MINENPLTTAFAFLVIFISFSARLTEVFANLESLEKNKAQLEQDIKEYLIYLTEVFTKDNIEAIRSFVPKKNEHPLLKEMLKEIDFPYFEKLLKELKITEDFVESLHKQLSKEKIKLCYVDTLLENIPKEILPSIEIYV